MPKRQSKSLKDQKKYMYKVTKTLIKSFDEEKPLIITKYFNKVKEISNELDGLLVSLLEKKIEQGKPFEHYEFMVNITPPEDMSGKRLRNAKHKLDKRTKKLRNKVKKGFMSIGRKTRGVGKKMSNKVKKVRGAMKKRKKRKSSKSRSRSRTRSRSRSRTRSRRRTSSSSRRLAKAKEKVAELKRQYSQGKISLQEAQDKKPKGSKPKSNNKKSSNSKINWATNLRNPYEGEVSNNYEQPANAVRSSNNYTNILNNLIRSKSQSKNKTQPDIKKLPIPKIKEGINYFILDASIFSRDNTILETEKETGTQFKQLAILIGKADELIKAMTEYDDLEQFLEDFKKMLMTMKQVINHYFSKYPHLKTEFYGLFKKQLDKTKTIISQVDSEHKFSSNNKLQVETRGNLKQNTTRNMSANDYRLIGNHVSRSRSRSVNDYRNLLNQNTGKSRSRTRSKSRSRTRSKSRSRTRSKNRSRSRSQNMVQRQNSGVNTVPSRSSSAVSLGESATNMGELPNSNNRNINRNMNKQNNNTKSNFNKLNMKGKINLFQVKKNSKNKTRKNLNNLKNIKPGSVKHIAKMFS
jgi:hypothetical protein